MIADSFRDQKEIFLVMYDPRVIARFSGDSQRLR